MSNPRFAHVHLRDRLDELVASVTHRLSLVLDQPRTLAVHDRAQLDRMTLEFASLQRTVLNELASPRAQREDVLATIFDLQLVALRLLDQIEALVRAKSISPAQASRPEPIPDPMYRGPPAAQLPPTNAQPPTPSEQLWPSATQVSPATVELHPPARQSREPYSQALKFAVVQSHAEASTQRARDDAGRYGESGHADGHIATQSALQFASFVSAPPRSNSTAIAVRPNTGVTIRAKPLRSARGWLAVLTPGRSAIAACSIIVGGLMVGWFMGSPKPDASPQPTQTRLESKLAEQERPTGVDAAGLSTGAIAAGLVPTEAQSAAPQTDVYVPVIATVEDPVAAQRRISQLKAAYPGLIDAVAGVNTELVRSADGTPWYRTYLLPARSRDTAKDFCRNLRQAGYQECWVKPLG